MKKLNILIILLAGILFFIPSVMAHCPLCTAAAGGGVGLARTFGVDDSIVGLFIGAFIVSTALWFNKWLDKKNVKISNFLIVPVIFLSFTIPFYYTGLITHFEIARSTSNNYAMTGLGILGMGHLGVDKLLFGMIAGTVVIWGAFSLSDKIKEKRKKVLWPFQGISFMLIALVILSLIFWILTK